MTATASWQANNDSTDEAEAEIEMHRIELSEFHVLMCGTTHVYCGKTIVF